jgi:hypothetical protein
MTTVKTNHGTYTGRTLDSIVRREYGRRAEALRSPDPNSPTWGQVVEPVAARLRARGLCGYNVLARIISIDGEYR